jgi:hypothetical protein
MRRLGLAVVCALVVMTGSAGAAGTYQAADAALRARVRNDDLAGGVDRKSVV